MLLFTYCIEDSLGECIEAQTDVNDSLPPAVVIHDLQRVHDDTTHTADIYGCDVIVRYVEDDVRSAVFIGVAAEP